MARCAWGRGRRNLLALMLPFSLPSQRNQHAVWHRRRPNTRPRYFIRNGGMRGADLTAANLTARLEDECESATISLAPRAPHCEPLSRSPSGLSGETKSCANGDAISLCTVLRRHGRACPPCPGHPKPGTRPRLSGSARSVVNLKSHTTPRASCPGLSRASTPCGRRQL
jgi:hypothetical protein